MNTVGGSASEKRKSKYLKALLERDLTAGPDFLVKMFGVGAYADGGQLCSLCVGEQAAEDHHD